MISASKKEGYFFPHLNQMTLPHWSPQKYQSRIPSCGSHLNPREETFNWVEGGLILQLVHLRCPLSSWCQESPSHTPIIKAVTTFIGLLELNRLNGLSDMAYWLCQSGRGLEILIKGDNLEWIDSITLSEWSLFPITSFYFISLTMLTKGDVNENKSITRLIFSCTFLVISKHFQHT